MVKNKMQLPNRKPIRLKEFDYSTPGAYFITICTKNRKNILSDIVGGDAHIAPKILLSKYGVICEKYIGNIKIKYPNVTVDKYIIMPNHIHLIISIHGTMKASSPTPEIKNIIRSFKIMVTKKLGFSCWQRSYYDHIIRNENDYFEIYRYIENNPYKWREDKLYNE